MHLNLCMYLNSAKVRIESLQFYQAFGLHWFEYLIAPVFQAWFWTVSTYNCIWQLDPFQKKIPIEKEMFCFWCTLSYIM